jgi:hypothetical protein
LLNEFAISIKKKPLWVKETDSVNILTRTFRKKDRSGILIPKACRNWGRPDQRFSGVQSIFLLIQQIHSRISGIAQKELLF